MNNKDAEKEEKRRKKRKRINECGRMRELDHQKAVSSALMRKMQHGSDEPGRRTRSSCSSNSTASVEALRKSADKSHLQKIQHILSYIIL